MEPGRFSWDKRRLWDTKEQIIKKTETDSLLRCVAGGLTTEISGGFALA